MEGCRCRRRSSLGQQLGQRPAHAGIALLLKRHIARLVDELNVAGLIEGDQHVRRHLQQFDAERFSLFGALQQPPRAQQRAHARQQFRVGVRFGEVVVRTRRQAFDYLFSVARCREQQDPDLRMATLRGAHEATNIHAGDTRHDPVQHHDIGRAAGREALERCGAVRKHLEAARLVEHTTRAFSV